MTERDGGSRPDAGDGFDDADSSDPPVGVDLTPDLEGEHVVGEDGRGVGVVTAVDAEGGRLGVKPEPSLADGLKAKFGWTDADGETRWVDAGDVEGMDGDRVVVRATVAAAVTPEDPDGAEGTDASSPATDAGVDAGDGQSPSDRIDLSDDDEGKEVVTPDGTVLGLVGDVDPTAGRFSLDPDPDMTERLQAALSGGDEGPYTVLVDAVESVEGSRVVVDPTAVDPSVGETASN